MSTNTITKPATPWGSYAAAHRGHAETQARPAMTLAAARKDAGVPEPRGRQR